jgi:hypothetical protein
VADSPLELHLAAKRFDSRRIARPAPVKDFNGHLATERRFMGAIDRAHSTPADDFQDAVTIGE